MRKNWLLAGALALLLVLALGGCPDDGGQAPNQPAGTPAAGGNGKNGGPTIDWPERLEIVLEAEDAALTAPMQLVPEPPAGAGGGQAVYVPDRGSGPDVSAHAEDEGDGTLTFTVAEAGDYYIWARAYFPDECADSFNLYLDGREEKIVVINSTHNTWKWTEVARHRAFTLAAGEHQLIFSNREDGALIDRFLLTTDGYYTAVDSEDLDQ